ncbi:peptidyl-prolyl cis-trans isomerase cpr6 [Cladochytrium tenue]|nr:peptidyl-prolyl cis-trans isomerase cpr6 [Cladochytrium tenue]
MPAEAAAAAAARPRVFMDLSIGGEPAGRVVFELYADAVPRTAANFLELCRGDRVSEATGRRLSYKGSTFHRVIKGFMIQGGDFTNHDGTGGESIYGDRFEDEAFTFKHDRPGLLSMANAGPGTNGSQFFVTTVPTAHLDGKHVVFGEVVKGMSIIRRIEHGATGENDRPVEKVVVEDAGVVPDGEDGGKDEPAPADGDTFEDYPVDYRGEKDPSTLMAIAAQLKGIGNDHFKKGAFRLAVSKYEKAIRYLNEFHPDPVDLDEVTKEQKRTYYSTKIACLSNSAMCHIKQTQYARAVACATQVLDLDDTLRSSAAAQAAGVSDVCGPADRCKALFRRGQARLAARDADAAVADLTAAAALMPGDAGVARELAAAQKAVKERAERERRAYAKMFS